MSPGAAAPPRGAWEGLRTVVRFNGPYYAAAVLALAAALAGVGLAPGPGWQRWIFAAVALASAWFLLASLAASHLAYDCSGVYRFGWLPRVLGPDDRRLVSCHTGYDESSAALHAHAGARELRVLDHYDEAMMTEPSIRRARRRHPPQPGTTAAPIDRWPIAAGWADRVFALFAIHELRAPAQRAAWFVEARRCLACDGRIVLVEHVRDLANVIAFGPGSLHFHTRAAWRRSWETAGLRCVDELRLGPFVRVLVLAAARG